MFEGISTSHLIIIVLLLAIIVFFVYKKYFKVSSNTDSYSSSTAVSNDVSTPKEQYTTNYTIIEPVLDDTMPVNSASDIKNKVNQSKFAGIL